MLKNRLVFRLFRVRYLVGSILMGIVACSLTLSAQAQSADESTDFSFYVGEMLPNQINGVNDILPIFGGRFSFVFPWGAIETELQDAHAQGVDWAQLGLSYRADFPLSSGVEGSFYAGPDFAYYIPLNDTERHGDYAFHAGLAALLQVKDSLWLRADFRAMSGNVGNSLEILAGVMFRPSSSSSP